MRLLSRIPDVCCVSSAGPFCKVISFSMCVLLDIQIQKVKEVNSDVMRLKAGFLFL